MNIPHTVITIGSTKKSELKALARGEGRVADAVSDAVADVIADHPDVDRDQVIPVVILYEEKRKKRRRGWLPMLGL